EGSGEGNAQSRVRLLPYREDFAETYAEAIGARLELAPFQLPGRKVFQFLVEGAEGRPAAMITLWPSIRRVDAIGAGAAVVFTHVASVQMVEDAELLFRRESGEYLVVAKGGKIVVRA
ncbi:MAG: hypothetical protein M3Z20_10280, partial [Chloroflexota bacterium]|nr:hypothetical protein [Chloroflexota bacterium]